MEQLHGDFAAYLFGINQNENKKLKIYDENILKENVYKVAKEVIQHEDNVIEYVFKGVNSINGITENQLKNFIRDRVNKTMELLGYNNIYEIEDNPIGEWFYRSSKSIKIHDFFAGITNQYSRSWQEESFNIYPYIGENNE